MNLAIFGGDPAFPEPLHVGRPNIGDRSRWLARVEEVLDRDWLTNDGPMVKEFEQRVAEILGVQHCVAMCNGTTALGLAALATGLQGEVILPAFTFIATAHALKWQGISTVFCDVDPETQCLDPEKVEALITPKTTGIIGVHLWGRSCAVEQLQEICDRHDLTLLFDAAHAFGCSAAGKMIGQFGSAEVFSFHATKFLHTFEGGAVVTNDDALADKLRFMRNFGFEEYDRVSYLGTNAKLNEVSAAMGITQLEQMDEIIAINRRNYEAYEQALSQFDGVAVLPFDNAERQNYQYIVAQIDDSQSPLTRDELLNVLHKDNVLVRRYFHPGCHNMEPYRSQQTHEPLPVTDALCRQVMQLPNGESIGDDQIKRIVEIIETALNSADKVREVLSHAAS